MVGSLQPSLGGAVIAHGVSLEELQHRDNKDPFVAENIVTSEILEIDPKKVDDHLQFLLD